MDKVKYAYTSEEIDEGTRANSIEEFGVAVCSMNCGVAYINMDLSLELG